MNSLKAPSVQSLMDSDRGSNDSLLAESLQLDLDEVKSLKIWNNLLCTDTLKTELNFMFISLLAGRCRILHSTC